MNKNLLILGAGAFGAIAYETAKAMGYFEKIDFLDNRCGDGLADIELLCQGRILGRLSALAGFAENYTYGIAALEDLRERCLWNHRLEKNGCRIPILTHPRAYVGKYAAMQQGCVIEALACVQSGSELGRGVWVGAGSVISCSTYVGDYCQLDAGSIVAAKSYMKEGTRLEAGDVFSGIADPMEGSRETFREVRIGGVH